MDDFIGAILGFLFVAWIVISAVLFVLGAIFSGLLWFGVNLLVVADGVLGIWSFVPPVLSWAVSGLALGSVLHFALVEFRQLPAATEGVLWSGLAAIAGVVASVVGAATLIAT